MLPAVSYLVLSVVICADVLLFTLRQEDKALVIGLDVSVTGLAFLSE